MINLFLVHALMLVFVSVVVWYTGIRGEKTPVLQRAVDAQWRQAENFRRFTCGCARYVCTRLYRLYIYIFLKKKLNIIHKIHTLYNLRVIVYLFIIFLIARAREHILKPYPVNHFSIFLKRWNCCFGNCRQKKIPALTC
jgi:hypothetical protein